MAVTITGAVTGGAQTGFTTPGAVLTLDNSPDLRSKQAYVSSWTGTMAGVTAHSISNPATVTYKRPALLKTIASALLNGVTGQYSRVPYNEWVRLVRKGANINASQTFVNEDRKTVKIYAGTEVYDAPNVRALESLAVGVDNLNSAGFGDTLITGTL